MNRVSETRLIAGHAFTILLGLWAVISLGLIDTWVASRHSPQALAGLAVGASIHLSVIIGCLGVLQAQLPIWAELHGARAGHALGKRFRQAVWILAGLCVLAALGLHYPGPLLDWTQVPNELRGEVREYLRILTLGLPGTLFFRLFSSLNMGLGRPRLVSVLQVLAVALKVPLSLLLVQGGMGLEPMGVTGCAWATVCVTTSQSLIALWLLRRSELYRPYRIWSRMEGPDWSSIRKMLTLGVPAGLTQLVEVTSFTLMALFIARLGLAATGAHQVVASIAGQLFMPALALAIAGSARVSYWKGAADDRRARQALRASLRLCIGVTLVQALAVWFARDPIAAFFVADEATAQLAGQLLGWLAIFHLGDALQVMGMFLLRCYRVVLAPLAAYVSFGWGVGLGGGYALAYLGWGAYPSWQSPSAFWATSALSLALLSALLLVLLWRAVRQHRQVQVATDSPARQS